MHIEDFVTDSADKYAQKPALSYQREETLVTSLAEARTALTSKRKIRTGTKKATT